MKKKINLKKKNLIDPKYYTKAKILDKKPIKWKKIDNWTYDIYVGEIKVGETKQRGNTTWRVLPNNQQRKEELLFKDKTFRDSHEAGKFLANLWILREKRKIYNEIETDKFRKKKHFNLDLDWDKWITDFKF